MTVKTRSKFYYGFIADNTKTDLIFNEGAGELLATVRVSQYSPTGLAIEVARALTEAGTQDYYCTFNRDARTFTIDSTANFDLLITSGVTSSSAFSLLGFTGADLVGLNTYTGNIAGKAFLPQFMLQGFIDFQDNEGFASATVKKTASGEVEVVSFGSESFAEMNISYQTNLPQGVGAPLENDPTGVENLREFMRYCIKKAPIEFMPDRGDTSVFTSCILESTTKSKDGVAFKLKELYGKGLIDYFESGVIKLRKL